MPNSITVASGRSGKVRLAMARAAGLFSLHRTTVLQR